MYRQQTNTRLTPSPTLETSSFLRNPDPPSLSPTPRRFLLSLATRSGFLVPTNYATQTCQKRVGGKNSFGRGEWKLGFKVSLYVRAHLFKTCSSCTSECTPFCLPAANPTALIPSLVGVNSGIICRARKSAAHGTLLRRENAKEVVFSPEISGSGAVIQKACVRADLTNY